MRVEFVCSRYIPILVMTENNRVYMAPILPSTFKILVFIYLYHDWLLFNMYVRDKLRLHSVVFSKLLLWGKDREKSVGGGALEEVSRVS